SPLSKFLPGDVVSGTSTESYTNKSSRARFSSPRSNPHMRWQVVKEVKFGSKERCAAHRETRRRSMCCNEFFSCSAERRARHDSTESCPRKSVRSFFLRDEQREIAFAYALETLLVQTAR